MILLNGKMLAEKIKQNASERAKKATSKPTLACILVGKDKASEMYVASKVKTCKDCGIGSKVVNLPETTSQKDLQKEIENLNSDKDVSAILLQLPLPKHLDESAAINTILPSKDVDCLTATNLGKLFCGQSDFAPCTATGIMRLLDEYHIEISGKNVVVIGRSLLVGRSVACLLQQRDATVTVCHSKTKNLHKFTKKADILIVAIGKAKFIKSRHVKRGAVVIDVGINRTDGKVVGDVDFQKVSKKAKFISPVPKGVGPLTVACLLENTLTLHEMEELKSKTTQKHA